MNTAAAFFDELLKLGFVSDDEAQGSLDRLDTLERNKPTVGQVARYSAIGGVAAPAVNVMKNAIKGKTLLEGAGAVARGRHLAADAVGGAVLTGAVPLIRTHLDRRAEMKKLHQYLQERGED